MKTEKSAGILVFRLSRSGPEVLLLHYEAGHWDFPKGKLEVDETEMQAALRELYEETGMVEIRIQPNWKETIQYIYTRKGERISKTVVFYVGVTTQGHVQLSDEHQGFEWLSSEQAEERLTFENAKKILRLATPIWKK